MKERYRELLEETFNSAEYATTACNLTSIQAIDNNQTVKVIQPTGVLDVTNCNQLRREIMAVVDAGSRHVLVDCQNLTFMDSSGLAALVLASQKVSEANSKLAICSINQQIEMLFALSSMDDIFEIYPSPAEFYLLN